MTNIQDSRLCFVTTLGFVDTVTRNVTMTAICLPTVPKYSQEPQNTDRMTLERIERRYLNLVQTRTKHDFGLYVTPEPVLDGGLPEGART